MDKIKVGYDSITNLYTFKTPGSYSAMNLCVNGQQIADPIRGQRVGELMTINEKPEIITYETSERKLTGFDNTETNTTISVEEYNKIVDQINETREYDDGDYIYETIEGEVFATRFFRTHKAIYEPVITIHNMDIEIISYPVSKYSNIVPLYSIDAKNVFETKCEYVPNNYELFIEICKDFGIDKNRISIPSHSGLTYVKIDEKYISGIEDFQKQYSTRRIANYDECVGLLNTAKAKLKEIISMHLAKQSQNIINKSTVGYMLTQLQLLQNSVYGLNVKASDRNKPRQIARQITELISILSQQS